MNGTHLGCQNGIALQLHLLGVLYPFIVHGPGLSMDLFLPPHLHGGNQAADADTNGTQIVHFIDFQQGVELVAALQNLIHLIRGHGIQSAAEGIELQKLQIIPVPNKPGGGVQPGMVDPLVHDPQVLILLRVRQTVLGEYRQAVGRDQFRDSMVDFRVNMVGPPGQHNTAAASGLHLLQNPSALRHNVSLGLPLLCPGSFYRRFDLRSGNIPFLLAEPYQPLRRHLFIGKSHKGTDIANLPLCNSLHVVFQVLSVGRHHGAAVVILGVLVLLIFIKNTGMENGGDALINQPLHMSVGQLGGVAFGFRWNGVHTQLVDFPVREGRQHSPEAQFPEEGRPEGIVLIHIQNSGQADGTSVSLCLSQRCVIKHPFLLIGHHIGGSLPCVRFSRTLFAAVSGDMPAATGEDVHGKHAVVGAAAAAAGPGGIGKVHNLFQRQHGSPLAVVVASGNQRRTKGAHEPRNIRTDDLCPGNQFKGPQHRLIMEGAALDYNVTAQLSGRAELDNLEQGVFDNGVGKARGNIRHLRSLFLGLLHIGVHKHCAAGSQVHGVLGKKGLPGKGFRRIAQRVGEILDKGAAAGRACLIEHNGVHGPVFQADALHILTADVQHAVHIPVKEGGGGAVGNGLHLALVQVEGGFQQRLAVACRAGAGNAGGTGEPGFQIPDGGFGRLNGVTLIIGIEGIEQLPLLTNQSHFCGGRTGVNSQIAIAAVGFQIGLFHNSLAVPLPECLIIRLTFKQRRKPGHLKGNPDALFQSGNQIVQKDRLAAVLFQSGTHSGKEVGILRIDHIFRAQLQGPDKCLFQLRQKVQGAAQKGHAAPDGLAAGEPGNGLIHHRLKNRGCQIRFRRALVDEGLDIRLGKHAAAGGDGVNLLIVGGFGVQPRGIRLQKGCHLVYKGAGASGADAVHPLLQAAGKIDDLGVLAAQLNGHIRLGIKGLQGRGHRHDLLNKANAHGLCQRDGAGTGDPGTKGTLPQLFPGVLQQVCQGPLGIGLVPCIVSVQQVIFIIQHRQLHRCGADINARAICIHGISLRLS